MNSEALVLEATTLPTVPQLLSMPWPTIFVCLVRYYTYALSHYIYMPCPTGYLYRLLHKVYLCLFYCIHHSTTNVNAQNVGRKMSQWHAMAPPTGHSPRICRWWIYSLPSMVNKFPIWAEAAAAAAWSSDKNKRNRRKQKTVGNRFWWLLKPWISSVAGDEGSYLPNCQSNLISALHDSIYYFVIS